MAIVRYDRRIVRRLVRHTKFIVSPPHSDKRDSSAWLVRHTKFIVSPPLGKVKYYVDLDSASKKSNYFYTTIEKWLSDDTFGGRAVPYNIPNRNKYKYLVYMDKLSKVRWGIVYEDMGNMRIVRITSVRRNILR